jgi:hypothetical protein
LRGARQQRGNLYINWEIASRRLAMTAKELLCRQ